MSLSRKGAIILPLGVILIVMIQASMGNKKDYHWKVKKEMSMNKVNSGKYLYGHGSINDQLCKDICGQTYGSHSWSASFHVCACLPKGPNGEGRNEEVFRKKCRKATRAEVISHGGIDTTCPRKCKDYLDHMSLPSLGQSEPILLHSYLCENKMEFQVTGMDTPRICLCHFKTQ